MTTKLSIDVARAMAVELEIIVDFKDFVKEHQKDYEQWYQDNLDWLISLGCEPPIAEAV